MEAERTIASVPIRSVGDTADRLLELAAAWGGSAWQARFARPLLHDSVVLRRALP